MSNILMDDENEKRTQKETQQYQPKIMSELIRLVPPALTDPMNIQIKA